MSKLIKILDTVIEKSLVLLMLFIVFTVTWQVFSRYVLQTPSSGSEELARFLLIWIGLFGAVYCYRTRAHLGLNIITNKMPANQRLIALLFSHVCVLFFSITTLILGGYHLVNMALDPVQISAALTIKMAYVYMVVPISGVLFCLYAVYELFGVVKNGLPKLDSEQPVADHHSRIQKSGEE